MTSLIASLKEEILKLKQSQTTANSSSVGNSSSSSNATPAQGASNSIVYVARDRKIKTFAGIRNEDNTVEEFIENIQSVIKARKMPVGDQSDYISAHLEGLAKEEIKLHCSSERDTAEKIYALLREAFGERRSLPQLLRNFYERRQKEGESLRSFSHALSELLERVIAKNPTAIPDRDQALRDQFSDNVREPMLRKELKRMARTETSCRFLQVREEALRWAEEEERPLPSRKTASNQETLCTASANAQEARAPEARTQEARTQEAHDPKLDMICKALEDQRKSMEKLSATLTAFAHTAQRSPVQPQPVRRKITCYNCNREGHLARDCRSRRTDSRPPPPRQNNNSDQPTQVSEVHHRQASNPLPLSS